MSSLESQSVYRIQTIFKITERLSDVIGCYPFLFFKTGFLIDRYISKKSLIKDELIVVQDSLNNLTSQAKKAYGTWKDLIDSVKLINTISALCKQECSIKQILLTAIEYLFLSVLVREVTVDTAKIKATIKGIDEWNDKMLLMKQLEPMVDLWKKELVNRMGEELRNALYEQRHPIYDGNEYKYMIELIELIELNMHTLFTTKEVIERKVKYLKWLTRFSSIQSTTISDFFRELEQQSETIETKDKDKSKRLAEIRDFYFLLWLSSQNFLDNTVIIEVDMLVWEKGMDRMDLVKEKTCQIMESYTNKKSENEKKSV
jgi:hypothetical protein